MLADSDFTISVGSGAVFGLICAVIASGRGRNAVGWFFLGLIFNCIALIVLLLIPDLNDEADRDRLDLDACSGLSEPLTYGEIGPRTIWHAGWRALERGEAGAEGSQVEPDRRGTRAAIEGEDDRSPGGIADAGALVADVEDGGPRGAVVLLPKMLARVRPVVQVDH